MTDNVEKRPVQIAKFAFIQLVVLAFLFAIREYNYNLSHAFVECYGIAVSLGIVFIVFNSNTHIDNHFIRILSTGYLCMILIDFLHMIAYKGMNIFIGYNSNLPTQLWILSRYVEGFALLLATLSVGKKIKINYIYLFFPLITISGVSLIFSGLFPNAFIEGQGLTPFKIISEYVIVGIILISLLLLFLKRDRFDKNVRRFLYLSFLSAILTDLMFTFYGDPFDVFNLWDIILKSCPSILFIKL